MNNVIFFSPGVFNIFANRFTSIFCVIGVSGYFIMAEWSGQRHDIIISQCLQWHG